MFIKLSDIFGPTIIRTHLIERVEEEKAVTVGENIEHYGANVRLNDGSSIVVTESVEQIWKMLGG